VKKNRKEKKRMTDKELYDRIKRGVENNVFVYDGTEDIVISKRLIYLMYSVSVDKMQKLYIPTDVYPDFDFAQPQYGVEVIRDRRLNYDEITRLVDEFGMNFPNDKGQIVLGVWGDESLLGAV